MTPAIIIIVIIAILATCLAIYQREWIWVIYIFLWFIVLLSGDSMTMIALAFSSIAIYYLKEQQGSKKEDY